MCVMLQQNNDKTPSLSRFFFAIFLVFFAFVGSRFSCLNPVRRNVFNSSAVNVNHRHQHRHNYYEEYFNKVAKIAKNRADSDQGQWVLLR